MRLGGEGFAGHDRKVEKTLRKVIIKKISRKRAVARKTFESYVSDGSLYGRSVCGSLHCGDPSVVSSSKCRVSSRL
jgi:hypothetical protein